MIRGWRVLDLWRDHTITMGPRRGVVVRANPIWYEAPGCFRVFPSGTNLKEHSIECKSLDEVSELLGQGYGARVKYEPGPGDNILYGDFKALLGQV